MFQSPVRAPSENLEVGVDARDDRVESRSTTTARHYASPRVGVVPMHRSGVASFDPVHDEWENGDENDARGRSDAVVLWTDMYTRGTVVEEEGGGVYNGYRQNNVDPQSLEGLLSVDDRGADGSGSGDGGGDGGALSVWASKLTRISPWIIVRVAVLCACVLGGQATQIIMLNFWLRQFPASDADGGGGVAGNYTIFAVSGIIFFLFFFIIFVVYVVVRRPDMRFMREPRAWGLLMRAAAMDTLTSALAIYAASHTSEVLQALFISMVPLYASVFTKLFLKDHRRYVNGWVAASFTCIVLGVFVATSANFGGDVVEPETTEPSAAATTFLDRHSLGSGNHTNTTTTTTTASPRPHNAEDSLSDRRWWALVFCAAIPLEVLMDIFQTLFMLRYTYDPDFFAYVARLIVNDGVPTSVAATQGNYREEDILGDGEEGTTILFPFDVEHETPARHRASRSQRNSSSAFAAAGSGSVNGSFAGVYRHPTSVTRLVPLQDPFTCHSHQRRSLRSSAAPTAIVEGARPHTARDTSPSRLGTPSSSRPAAHDISLSSPSVSVATVPDLGRLPHAPANDVTLSSSVPRFGVDGSGDAWMLSAGRLRPTGDDTTVKLTMLCVQTFFQCLFTFMWLPMDALPWYGGSDNVTEAWSNFAKGVDCLLNCPNNLLYGALYSAGFVFVYIGAAYLNQYSVTLCAMVSQLSGPVTALLLIAFPALNVTGDSAPWYVSLAAVCLLTAGTFVYVVWDEKTAAEKEAGELELKMEMHGLLNLAARHAEHIAVTIAE